MKKITSILLAGAVILLSVFSLTGCGTNNTVKSLVCEYSREYAGTTLNVYNWGEYISDGSEGSLDTVATFEKVTGINVNYITYESNEVMYSKLKSGSVSYDVIIPSDYMIARLMSEDMLMKIDYSKIANYSLIDAKYKDLYFDPTNEYSVPYSVGLFGLIYNTKYVEAPKSWDVMWDEQYKGNILTFGNPRDAFAIAQFLLGSDINSENKADWDAATEKLKAQSPLLQGRVMDEVFNKMESENAYIAPYYVGDFLTMYGENSDLAFVYPEEGTNIYVDSMCIPSCCKNYEAALMFINFMLEPEVAVANAEYICYASPNTAVVSDEGYISYMADMHPDWKYLIYDALTDESMKSYYYHDLPTETRSYYESLWKEVVAS